MRSRNLSIALPSLMFLILAGCSEGRGRGGVITPRTRDAGPVAPTRDGGTVVTRDAGPDLCANNPNGCVAHQLKGSPPDCACLPVCETGWEWTGTDCQMVVGRDGGMPPGRDGGTPPGRDGGMIPSDPFNAATAAQQFASAFCAHRTRCEPALYGFLNENAAQCMTDQLQGQTVVYNVFSQMIAAGRLAFSQADFNTCMASYGSVDCVLSLDPACDRMFRGSRGVGQSCMLGEECAGAAWCQVTGGLGACGACAAPVGNGADCSNSVCDTGLVCATAGAQTICVPHTANVGGTCGTIATGLCVGNLQCVNGSCARPAANGAMCDPNLMTAPDCNIFMSSVCNNGTCAQGTWGGTGASCAAPNLCDNTSACNQTTTMCDALPGANQACNNMNCAPTAYCNAQNQCVARAAPGGACMAAQECQLGLWCYNSQCGNLGYQVCP